jgi:hypothetical protein
LVLTVLGTGQKTIIFKPCYAISHCFLSLQL